MKFATFVCGMVAWRFASLATAFSPGFVSVVPDRLSRMTAKSNDVDVSDLGLTMEDLNQPLPQELLQGISSTGYESTSRLPSVEDDGCEWTETADEISVKLRVPGLRGQPAAAASVLFSTTTISVSFFGRVVWSAILRGTIDPDASQFESEDGTEMIPLIKIQVAKAAASERWGGFILQVGEDSLI